MKDTNNRHGLLNGIVCKRTVPLPPRTTCVRCISCGEVNAALAVDFRCTNCGDLLEVEFTNWSAGDRHPIPHD